MPSDSAPPPPARLLGLTARIVSAHVGRNPVAPERLPELIRGVHRALGGLGQDGATTPAEPVKPVPAVPVRRSVVHDRITCLECGARMAMLKRHLASAHQLTLEAYRERWGLGRDYPMVAPDYAEVRSGLAKQAGLGRVRRGGQVEEEREVELPAAPDTADAEPPALMAVEPAAPAPRTGRGRKRGSPTSPEEVSRPEPEARADAPEDAAPAEDAAPGAPAPPASGGRRRRRATRCLVPGFDGAIFSPEWKDALWARFSMYRVHTVLTDNGTHFTTPGNTASAAPLIKEAIARGEIFRAHAFELACAQNDIDHCLTKPRHPWTNGQVERMNRTLKDATVKRYHYESHGQLRQHLGDFVTAYNFARRLKALCGLTPYEFICRAWTKEPGRFTLNPLHQMPGLNI